MQNPTEKHKISAAKLDFACLEWKVFKLYTYMRIQHGPFKYAPVWRFFFVESGQSVEMLMAK